MASSAPQEAADHEMEQQQEVASNDFRETDPQAGFLPPHTEDQPNQNLEVENAQLIAAPNRGLKPPLPSLPIGRDNHGRSPLVPSSYGNAFVFSDAAATPITGALTPRMGSALFQIRDSLLIKQKVPGMEVLSLGPTMKSREAAALKVACHGTPTGRAMARVYHPQAKKVGIVECAGSTEAVFEAVADLTADRAVLPVESSTEGSCHRTYDLLLRNPLHIVGELPILKPEPQTPSESITRFWVLAREPLMPEAAGQQAGRANKTTVALVLNEGLGSLHKVLGVCFFRRIVISKIESRPWRSQPLVVEAGEDRRGTYFQYVVFMDVEGSTAEARIQSMLAQLLQYCAFLRVLGSYPVVDLQEFNALRTPRTPRLVPSPRAQQQQEQQLVSLVGG